MPRKGHSPEQVLNKLRQVEVAVAGGKSVGVAVREIGVTDHTYYRWRREYGGLNLDQARRLKKLEQDNARLKRSVGGPALDKPTIASLSDPAWAEVTTIVEEDVVRVIVPQLKKAGAEGIVEYPLNKIIE